MAQALSRPLHAYVYFSYYAVPRCVAEDLPLFFDFDLLFVVEVQLYRRVCVCGCALEQPRAVIPKFGRVVSQKERGARLLSPPIPVPYPYSRCEGISRVLVRVTTCKKLTNCLPKLSLITLSPPETAG